MRLRPRLSFRLRTLLALIAIVAVSLGVYLDRLRREEIRQRLAQPIIDAAGRGELARVRELLDEGADIEAVTNGRAARTPLMQASAGGHLDLVRFLLERGADPNHLDVDYFGPLTFAADEAHWDVVRLLIEHGANPGMGDGYGKTALDYAKAKGPPEMVRYLEAKQKAVSGP
jgi:ankyrin repeat protein